MHEYLAGRELVCNRHETAVAWHCRSEFLPFTAGGERVGKRGTNAMAGKVSIGFSA
jgi:hypothetical protein